MPLTYLICETCLACDALYEV